MPKQNPHGPLAKMTDKTVASSLARCPQRYAEWLASVGPVPEPEDRTLIEEARDFWAGFAMGADGDDEDGRGDGGDGADRIELRPELAAIHANLLAGIGAIITGRKLKALREDCGLSWTQLSLVAHADKAGFGRLFELARKERDARRIEEYRDELDERIRNGSEKAFVVRTARDHDEVQIRRVANDSLLSRQLDRSDMRNIEEKRLAASAATSPSGGAGSVNIGTVYNIQVPSFLAPAAQKVIDADASAPAAPK